jgi:glutamate-1-semialdehyde 2,1-aminomutase
VPIPPDSAAPVSRALFARATARTPGGVNSPVRAFRAVGGSPIFIASARGARVTDEDGRTFLDYIGSWGPMILGHCHPEVVAAVQHQMTLGASFGAPTRLEVEMAEQLAARVPGLERVRLVNSGTEATMAAVRVARGATGRSKITKFEGCYHGHGDAFLIKAGSGAATIGVPDSPGVTDGTARDTLATPFNDLAALARLFDGHRGDIAAVILEPVVGNMGVVAPRPGFLEGVRELCTRDGAALIVDEVMTGFRLARGGAQERYGVVGDLVTLGKIIGGGLPVGAYGGRAALMSHVAPDGPIYQAGTLSGNPLAMAAGLATLGVIDRTVGFYDRLEQAGSRLEAGIGAALSRGGYPCRLARVGSMWTLFFTSDPVHNWTDAAGCDRTRFGRFFHEMLARGVSLAPSQFEANFLSIAHTDADIDETCAAVAAALEHAWT